MPKIAYDNLLVFFGADTAAAAVAAEASPRLPFFFGGRLRRRGLIPAALRVARSCLVSVVFAASLALPHGLDPACDRVGRVVA